MVHGMKLHNAKNTLLGISVSLTLFFCGWYAHDWYHHRFGIHKERRIKASGFRFTSPLLDVELPEGMAVNRDIHHFKYKVNELVAKLTDGTKVNGISVYYRDLADGPWFGINENVVFNPASMMKVPLMISWLKRAEKRPEILKKKILFDENIDMSAMQNIKPRYTLEKGHEYTVEVLLEYMMAYSDNNATSLLFKNISQPELNAVLDGMDVDNHLDDGNNSISVHGYSGFFRILYNASFLSREMSEKALELLSKEEFPQGISAGVPKGTIVAGKYGETQNETGKSELQLHEFGIVYHPKGHYILGIMTRGNDIKQQTDVIREISALVYHEVDAGEVISN